MWNLFSSYGGDRFLYDAGTNKIHTVKQTPPVMEVFAEKAQENCENPFHGHGEPFSSVHWEKSFQEFIRDIQRKTPKLLIELTRECNLNCEYCVYSGNYSQMRPHSHEGMSVETLIASIDFFSKHCAEAESVSVGFYGGEALLRFPLIVLGVDYARRKLAGRNLEFSISTNGYKIEWFMLEWLRQTPEAYIVVTLNGPFHDHFRKTMGGEGSLAQIMINMRMIREEFPDIWNNQVMFQANIASEAELPAMLSFYRQNIGRMPDSISKISVSFGNAGIKNRLSQREPEPEAIHSVRMAYIKQASADLNCFFDPALKRIHFRGLFKDSSPQINSCFPLHDKLYIYWNGDIGICESACDKIKLGNVFTGIDYPALRKIYDDTLALFDRQCLNCWNRRLCPVCYRDILDTDGTIVRKIPEETCERFRTQSLNFIRMYCDKVHNGTWRG